MATINGGSGKDFIHRAGDGRIPPLGYVDVIGVSTGADTINGLAGDDIIYAEAGNDTINGGAGVDDMHGGTGNDIYIVDNIGDLVIEAAGEGIDKVRTTLASYTLGANIENLVLIGSGNFAGTGNTLNNVITGGAGNDVLSGGAGNDRLNGNAGNDILNGGVGIDAMIGGAGDDTYVVDNVGDTLSEDFGAGTDLVRSFISFTLATNFENLTLIGSDPINGTGNAVANVLTGNTAANLLNGGFGNDTLLGGGGGDTLIGGPGADILKGATGIDTADYSTGTSGVYVSLADNAKFYYVNSDALGDTFDSVENLRGTVYHDILEGDAGNNRLEGNDSTTSALSDMLYGFAGNDVLVGSPQGDLLDGGAGDDRLVPGEGTFHQLAGGAGFNTVDYSTRETGVYIVKNVLVDGGTNDAFSDIERIIGTSKDDLIYGDYFDEFLIGGGGKDHLSGMLGTDTLTGGAGGDFFEFLGYVDGYDATHDKGFGTDTITDFSQIQGDRIDLSRLQTAGDLGLNFIFTQPFDPQPGQPGEVRYDIIGGSTVVEGYTNGGFPGETHFQINLLGSITLDGGDFFL